MGVVAGIYSPCLGSPFFCSSPPSAPCTGPSSPLLYPPHSTAPPYPCSESEPSFDACLLLHKVTLKAVIGMWCLWGQNPTKTSQNLIRRVQGVVNNPIRVAWREWDEVQEEMQSIQCRIAKTRPMLRATTIANAKGDAQAKAKVQYNGQYSVILRKYIRSLNAVVWGVEKSPSCYFPYLQYIYRNQRKWCVSMIGAISCSY